MRDVEKDYEMDKGRPTLVAYHDLYPLETTGIELQMVEKPIEKSDIKSEKHVIDISDEKLKNGGYKTDKDVSLWNESDENKKAQKEKPKMIGTMELFRFATRYDVMLMVVGTICACAHGAALPSLMLVFGDMINKFVVAGTPLSANQTAIRNATGNLTAADINAELMDVLDSGIKKSAYTFVGIGCAVFLLAYIRVTMWLHTSLRQSHKIRVALFTAILRQEIGWFDTNKPGELGSRMTDDVNKIQQGIGDKIANFLQWFFTFIAGIIIGLAYGWKLALVILSLSPMLVIAGGMMNYLLSSASTKELDAYAKAGAIAEEVFSSIRTVVAFGGQSKECVRYSKNLIEAKDFGIRKSIFAGAGAGLVFFIIFCTYALSFWYGGKLTRDEPDNYKIGIIVIVFFAVLIGAFALGNAAPNLEYVATARAAAYGIFNIIDRKSAIDSSSDGGIEPSSLTGDIEFKDVTFRYPSRPSIPVANGLSIKVMKGQTVALVGPSGCGKSTVVQLLQRFYDPLSGVVSIDGIDIRKLNIKWLRRNIGIVSQEPNLFATTIAENISYGRDGVTQEEIEKAAREANVHEFISKLPLKYETFVGERGAQLSGGQKQRIAIARALVRNPRILLLDEATSALDTESEATVQAALDKARLGRTTIVIAHRLSTIRTADIIYSIKDGVVQESGTHASLMELGGIYHQLVTNQQLMNEDEDEDLAEGADLRGLPSTLLRALSTGHKMQSVDAVIETKPVADADTEEEEKLADPSFMRLMSLNAKEWPYIVVGCLAGVLQGVVQPVFAIIFSSILGVFGNPDLEYQERKILMYSLIFLAIGGASGIAYLFQGWMFGISGEKFTMRVRELTFEALLRQDIGFFDDSKNTTGALSTRLSTDASAMRGSTGSRVGLMFQSVASIGTGIIIGFIYSWKLALFMIGIIPIFLIGGMLVMKSMNGFAAKGSKVLEQAGQVTNETIVNVRTVASLTKEQKFISDYERLIAIPFRAGMRKAHISGVTFAFSQSTIFFAYAAIFSFGAWLIRNDGLEFENMFKVFAAIVFGAMAVGQATQFSPDYGNASASAARVFALLDRVPPIDSYSTEGKVPAKCEGTLEFRDVHFHYPTRKTVPVLQGLSFNVEKGKTIALVGSSGCGKSTTVQLLERFYDSLEGQVCIDRVNVKDLAIQWLRSQIGIVSQEPILFDCSIAENIAYGDNSRTIPMEEIIAAAKESNIHSFIQGLPEGYNTNVGSKGTQLSGGQKQRIAIARALVRNPKILLLDEATSALDTESEKVVQEALDRAQLGRTSLVIAHRLSTVQNANCIVVFRQGRVAESGTHSELIAHRGLYYRLQLAQSMNV